MVSPTDTKVPNSFGESFKSGVFRGPMNLQTLVNRHINAPQAAELDSNMANSVTLPNYG